GVVVAAPFGGTIGGKVFRGREDAPRSYRVAGLPRPLEAPHAGTGECGAELRILTRPLCDPPPAWVTRDVHHRSVCPVHAGRRGLERRDLRGAGSGSRVPTARLGERNREDDAVPVDDVETEQQRD